MSSNKAAAVAKFIAKVKMISAQIIAAVFDSSVIGIAPTGYLNVIIYKIDTVGISRVITAPTS